jgi:hypothetical protein
MWRLYFSFFAMGCLASAQDALSGPSLGFFFDSRVQALRRIWGLPGSAIASQTLDLGFQIGKAAFSPAQSYAFAVSTDGSVNVIWIGQDPVTAQTVTALAPAPDQIAISPSGHAAAFSYGGSVKILTGLPGSLDRLEEVDISALPSAPVALAISDDGAVFLVSVPGNTENSYPGGVYVFSRGDSAPRLVTGSMASDLNFLAESHDALITDEGANSVTALADIGGTATSQWVFVDDRMAAPSVARANPDSLQIVIGSAKDNAVALLNRNGGDAVFIPCACVPNRINPLNGSVYQLTDPDSGLIWILDLTQEPRLLFVPMPPLPGDSQ